MVCVQIVLLTVDQDVFDAQHAGDTDRFFILDLAWRAAKRGLPSSETTSSPVIGVSSLRTSPTSSSSSSRTVIGCPPKLSDERQLDHAQVLLEDRSTFLLAAAANVPVCECLGIEPRDHFFERERWIANVHHKRVQSDADIERYDEHNFRCRGNLHKVWLAFESVVAERAVGDRTPRTRQIGENMFDHPAQHCLFNRCNRAGLPWLFGCPTEQSLDKR